MLTCQFDGFTLPWTSYVDINFRQTQVIISIPLDFLFFFHGDKRNHSEANLDTTIKKTFLFSKEKKNNKEGSFHNTKITGRHNTASKQTTKGQGKTTKKTQAKA